MKLMSELQSNTLQLSQPNYVITLRKVNVRSQTFHGTKISVVIEVQRKDNNGQLNGTYKNLFENSQARVIKNGVTSFYGQAISIGPSISKITFTLNSIVDGQTKTLKQTKKQLIKFQINQDKINLITQRKNTFSTGSQIFQLIWQGTINYQTNQMMEFQEQDRSLQDFQDIQPKKQLQGQNQLLLGRKNYSPAVRGQTRNKRNSMKKNRVSLISQSPYKLTIETNQTSENLKKKMRVKLLSPSKQKMKNQLLESNFFQKRPIYNSSQQQCRVGSKQKQKIEKLEKDLHPVLSLNQKKIKPNSFQIRQSMTPKNSQQNFHKRKAERFLQRISFKSLLYTSVIGIIGGVAAAQF